MGLNEVESRDPRYLLLAATDPGRDSFSGYTEVARHIAHARLIRTARVDPMGFLQRAGTALLTRPAFTKWYRFGSFAAEWQAYKAIRAGFTGVVHFLWADRDLGFLDRLSRTPDLRLFTTFHACPDTLPDIMRDPARVRALDGVILMSQVQTQFFLDCGVPAERIHVVLHGVDTEAFRPGTSTRPRPFTVVSVGNYRRNFGVLREVCERLTSVPDIRVRIVAPAARRPLFAGLANVDFLSGLSQADLLAAYQTADCSLITVHAATANNALLEALACGLPIVSEDVGGIGEYTGGDAAILCAKGSAQALTGAIIALRDHPARRLVMGAAARSRAVELCWKNVAERTVEIYERAGATRTGRFATS